MVEMDDPTRNASPLRATFLLIMSMWLAVPAARGQDTARQPWAATKPVTVSVGLDWAAPDVGARYAEFYARLSRLNGRIIFLDLKLTPRAGEAVDRISITLFNSGAGKSCDRSTSGIINADHNVLFSLRAPTHNHALLRIRLRKKTEFPVQTILCVYPTSALKLSGLFLVARSSTPTADLIELYPVRFTDIR